MANLSSYLPDGIDESSVQITGGTINGTTIGASTAAAGTFTTVTGSGDLAIDTDTLFVDVSADKVGIGTDSPAVKLHINGTGDLLKLTSTNDSSSGAQIDLMHFSASPADDDDHGIINFGGYYTGTTTSYGSSIKGKWTDVSERHGALTFLTRDGGTFEERMRIDSSGRIGLGDQPATTNGLFTLQSDTYYSNLVELYGSGDKKTYISGRFGILGNNSFVCKIGGVYSGYAGLSFDYYYLYPLIQETQNNGDLRLGSSSYRFHTLYSVNGTSTSDERVKEEIENLDVGLDFIKALQPKKFKYRDKDEEGNYKDGRLDQPDGVKKWGLIAQDVKQVLDDSSITEDLGLWSVDEGECNGEILEDQQQLQYQELIAPLINAVKEQQALIETLQTEVAELKAN